MPLSPVVTKRPNLLKFLWRYFTGHHLDGKNRTNAGWVTRGTVPAHHVNWWSAKPRIHRMFWRWLTILGPVGCFACYRIAPSVRLNVTILALTMALPYVFHHGIIFLVSLIPGPKVVVVQDTVMMEHVNAEIDHVIREPLGDDDGISELTELELPIEIENERSKRRRS